MFVLCMFLEQNVQPKVVYWQESGDHHTGFTIQHIMMHCNTVSKAMYIETLNLILGKIVYKDKVSLTLTISVCPYTSSCLSQKAESRPDDLCLRSK